MSASPDRPNIVLIISDQHNPHFMGCAGNELVQTPNLDRLAAQGVRFTNVHCPSPLCVPSRMAFMTGRYPSENQVWSNGCQLSSDIPTFAHGLGAGGYEAILCGRMHFVGSDQFHGFERRIIGDVSGSHLTAEIRGTGSRGRTTGQSKYAVEVSGHGLQGYAAYDNAVTDTAVDFLNSDRDVERPFCMVVGYVLPHNPLICSKELFDYYYERLPAPEPMSSEYLGRLHPAVKSWRERRGIDELTPEQNRRGLAAYYGLCTELDRNAGRVIDAVRASSAAEDTAIIYCSDHGDMACEHGMWWKSNFYTGSVQVPCIASWPGHFEESKQVDAVANLIDLGPTLLDLAGCDPLPNVSGCSLAGFLREGDGPGWEDTTFSEICPLLEDAPACMLRRGPWKMVYFHETESFQLFNLDEDPGEMNDLRDSPEHQSQTEEMLAEIHACWSAEYMLDQMAENKRAVQLIRKSGHSTIPHEIDDFVANEEDNAFDFGQLPWWPMD
ncbi:MAG: sulfatase-like hydrolase/transferase [Planctomycetota bacterium]|jgi:choline-sulfatase|nr:sulfatase-like hydrolase/transferase [Planctomycetota bacterium]MDP7252016.1 sulfatase-like hydrolase/transferase [Planctomycetota bacterium]